MFYRFSHVLEKKWKCCDLATPKVFQVRSSSPPDLCHAQLQSVFDVTWEVNGNSSRFKICKK